MRIAPADLPEDLVFRQVRAAWGFDIHRVEHLPWGFGAWHWGAEDSGGIRRWFITADRLESADRLAELERVYAIARGLSETHPVVACLPNRSGHMCWRTGEFALSVTSWTDGSRPGGDSLDSDTAVSTARFLADLHAVPIPPGLPVWDPNYPSHRVLDDLPDLVASRWDGGPYGEEVRALVRTHLDDLTNWRQRYAKCADHAMAHRNEWVLTHGEPGPHNQLLTSKGRRWVDWESARTAPRERDLMDLASRTDQRRQRFYPHALDPINQELFDLAWRLDEIGQYTDRFRDSHAGTADDRIALDGLRQEFTRPDRRIDSRD
ncbi:phosphotransferase family protein [Demetria terragena]|uniref:phosphotransferase family protein n=1 Tax=Demetria terragena TaxID=63959 RepID=UPI00037C9394|nr:phosphotransferase [Demetria terragena]